MDARRCLGLGAKEGTVLHASVLLQPLLAAYRGWGWGWWWWWWWIVILFFFWVLLLPPFAYGRRWYTGYRSGSAIRPLSVEDDAAAQWQAIESHFVAAPASAVIEADRWATDMLSRRGTSPMSDPGYREAHAIALKAQRGEANTDELHAAMLTYRTLVMHAS